MLALIDAMNNMYDFVDMTKPLQAKDLDVSRRKIIKYMLQETRKCGWLIHDYTSRSFGESDVFRIGRYII
jgi:hypothetical protein